MAMRNGMVGFSVDITIPKMVASVALGAYLNQAILVPNRTANLARAYADRRGGGLLSFCPPPGVHLKSVFIRNGVGDVNLHHSASRGPIVPRGTTVYGNPYRLPFRDRSFAAVFSYGTLERLERPELAILEWQRVAERVFVVVPQIWMPESWFNPWYISPDLRRAWPLWTNQSRTVWLPPARRRAYDATTCRTPQRPRPPSMPNPSAQGPMGRPITPPSMPTDAPAPPGPDSNSSAAQSVLSLPIVNLLPPSNPELEEDYTSEEASSASPSDQPYLPPIVGFPSSTSVSSMMIVSGPDQEND
jgi:hypothetical protein